MTDRNRVGCPACGSAALELDAVTATSSTVTAAASCRTCDRSIGWEHDGDTWQLDTWQTRVITEEEAADYYGVPVAELTEAQRWEFLEISLDLPPRRDST